ncbi:flagellar hook-length control protein FliK [uncultured Shewanella sp.]|uniref:flagellar hook-length control protein FliK n=1 Tax=uncultured Shewanella sp. TaxID=173975 RepID=UPI002620E63B|nr:flagellar hook-length control protein FliK [uncultured Shewanella sp.]
MTSSVLPSTFAATSATSTVPSAIRAHAGSHYSDDSEFQSGNESLPFSLIQPITETAVVVSGNAANDFAQPLSRQQAQTTYSNTQPQIDGLTQAINGQSIEQRGNNNTPPPLNQQIFSVNPLATHNASQATASPALQVTTDQAKTTQLSTMKELVANMNTTPPANTSFEPVSGLLKPGGPTSYTGFQAVTQQLSSTYIATLAENTGVDTIDSANQIAASSRAHSTVAQWGPVSVSQSAPMLQQSHEMLSPLREQLRFQIDQQIKQAELRLDPPELGKIELNVRLDGDRLHIQMHAANSSVRDALLMGLDRLRAELAMDHGGQIDVDISQGESQQQKQGTSESVITAAKTHENQQAVLNVPQQDQVDLLA